LAGTKSRFSNFALRSRAGENIVIGRQYFVRQAGTLLEFARATNDPELAIALIEKAADLLSQIDEPSARPDPTPLAPDIEPPALAAPFHCERLATRTPGALTSRPDPLFSSAVKIFQVIERGSIFRSKRRLGLQAFAV